MIYLIRSYGPGGKSILKIGFSDQLDNRLAQYFYMNPFSEVLETKEGDEIHESLLHLYLEYLGLSFTINGKLNEWFIDSPEVIKVFSLSLDDLSDKVWESRSKIFNGKSFNTSERRGFTYRIFKFLYTGREDTLRKDQFIVGEDGSIIKVEDFLEVDKNFWDAYQSINPPVIELPEGYSEESVRIVDDFLENNFGRSGAFRDRMKMYCNFRDSYKDNSEVTEILEFKIEDPRFKVYYEFFGTSGCSSKKYEEKNLLTAMRDDSREDRIREEIYSIFKTGDKYTSKDLKEMVRDLYFKLSISRNPKATDLGKYFEMIKTKITLPDKTTANGFKFGRKLK